MKNEWIDLVERLRGENARLRAKNKELLEACKVGLQWVPKTKSDAAVMRAAIAKEGKK